MSKPEDALKKEADRKKARAFIRKLMNKYSAGDYIFRGTTERYSKISKDGINSTLYRWALGVGSKKTARQEKIYQEAFANNPNFFPSDMEKEIVEKAARLFPSNTKPHEILTDLQHFGGNTNMIDFSRNMYVALFFACQGKNKENGELIALRKNKLKEIDEIKYSQRPQKGVLEVIAPAGTQDSRQRVNFQGSVFVRPANGYIDRKKCLIKEIPSALKSPLLEHLRAFHNITVDTIYNDLHGFIRDEKNNETGSLYLYLGLANHKKGQLKTAIKNYNQCLERNPGNSAAYNGRGGAHLSIFMVNQGNPAMLMNAMDDFDSAIALKEDYAEAYFNLGNVHLTAGGTDEAIESFKSALFYKEKFAEAYKGLGDAYAKKNEYERAIWEYNKAILHENGYALAYLSRGKAYLNLHEKEINAIKPAEGKKSNVVKNEGKDKITTAIENFDLAIYHDPNCFQAYHYRHLAKKANGDIKGSREDFVKYVKLSVREDERAKRISDKLKKKKSRNKNASKGQAK